MNKLYLAFNLNVNKKAIIGDSLFNNLDLDFLNVKKGVNAFCG